MAGSGNIRAGAAFVEITLRDNFTKPLKNMSATLKSFGAGVAAIGATTAAAGAAITAPFIAGVKTFADFGSAIFDAGQRSGLSAEMLSTLQYAADQTGASLGDVETGAKKLNVVMAGAAAGSKSAAAALAAVGLSYADLKGLSPDEQFRRVIKSLGGMEDKSKQVAAAIALFGKSGAMLVPLAADFGALEVRAKALGLVISGDMASSADALGDSLKDLELVFGALFRELGAAIAGPITKFATLAAQNGAAVIQWVRANGPLIEGIAAIGAVLVVAGTAMVAAGAAIVGLGAVIGTVAGAAAALPTIISAIPTALALIGIAVASAALILGDLAIALKLAGVSMSDLAAIASTAAGNFKLAMGGISDALAGGDIILAAKVAMAGVKKIFYDAAQSVGGIMTTLLEGVISVMQAAFIALGPPIYLLLDKIKSKVAGTLDFSGAAAEAAKDFQQVLKAAENSKGAAIQAEQKKVRDAADKPAIDAISKRAEANRKKSDLEKSQKAAEPVLAFENSLINGIVDLFNAPGQALKKALVDVAPAPTPLPEVKPQETFAGFDASGAFAALSLPALLGGSPDKAADETANNTAKMVDQQEKSNQYLLELKNKMGVITFAN